MIVVHDMPQRSEEWYAIRLGRVTGSVASKYFNLNGKLKSDNVIYNNISKQVSELILGYDDSNKADSIDMYRGRSMEGEALADLYSKDWSDIGFVTNTELPNMGVSPDAVLYIGGEIIKGAEVKCPTSTKHINYMLNGNVPNDYKIQIGMQFIIMPTIESVIFRSYNPQFDSKTSVFDVKVERGDWKSFLDELNKSAIRLGEIINESVNNLS